MIIEFIQSKNSPRGRASYVIEYFFDVDSNGCPVDRKQREEVRFIGASSSLCCADPFHPLKDDAIAKLAQRIDLSDFKNAFEEMEQKNKRVKLPYLHIVLSLREGESLTQSSWYELICDYIEALGYTDNHWVAVSHHNTNSQHAHLLLSCIENSAPHRKTKDGHNFALSGKIRDKLEQKYGLEQDNNPFVSGEPGLQVSNSQFKTKIQCVRDQIDNAIESNDAQLTLPAFIEKLANEGVGSYARLQNQQVEGLSFSLGAEYFSGAALGFGYSWPELQRRGLVYQADQHLRRVRYSNQREQAVSQLISNGYDGVDFHDNTLFSEYHHLLVPNDQFTESPDQPNLHCFNIFKLFTPLERLANAVQGKLRQRLTQLRQLRQNLVAIYDFVRIKGRTAVQSFTESIYVCGSNMEFMYETPANVSVIKELVRLPHNYQCLFDTGFLLVSTRCFKPGETGASEYELKAAAERPSSIDSTEEESLDNPSGVIVLGDYHSILNGACGASEAAAPVTIRPNNDTPSKEIKAKRQILVKRKDSDWEFTF